ncbi:hypothetical protein [Streptococcus suis]|uniref:hypothetical protein n=1 Tax=Streptococcus suis TaxID=1307 RepID=UPI000CF624D1|nr:hypothetical protein [Streptococcus suis]
MNKRIKKKRVLFEHIKTLDFVLDKALTVIGDQAKEITELRSIIERNAQAVNSEIESLRNEIKLLKKPKKKSFFNRK